MDQKTWRLLKKRPTVYLATAWNDKETIRAAASAIRTTRSGPVRMRLNARWVELALSGRQYGDASPKNVDMARMDLEDLAHSDGVLVIPNRDQGTGHHIEFGYALAMGKPVVIVGKGWTIFHALCPQVPDLTRAVELLRDKISVEVEV